MKKFFTSVLFLAVVNLSAQVNNCLPPTSQSDLDINNVRATILAGGDMWRELSTANPGYEIPKGSGRHSMFTGAWWIGGLDAGNQLKIAAQTYRQSGNDFFTGPINQANTTTNQTVCSDYDRHWKITRQEVMDFINSGIPTQTILDWPGNGDPALNHPQFLAPFVDINSDGIYNPADGDYPYYDFSGTTCQDVLLGDQSIWWVFNDVGNIHTETQGIAIGLEVHAQGYAYNSFDDAVNNSTFYNYKLINRSSADLHNVYLGFYADLDVGNYLDDYVGSDVGLNLAYGYNGDSDDEGVYGYGLNPPAVGFKILEGPKDTNSIDLGMTKFVYYNNDFSLTGNPSTAAEFYNYLKGNWKDGTPLTFGGTGYGGSIVTSYAFPDSSDPANPTLWSEGSAGNLPSDRRFLPSSGPFTLQSGQVHYVNTAVVWARTTGGGPIASLLLLKTAAATVQNYFDNCFLGVGITENEFLDGIKLFPNPSVSGKFILANLPSNSEIAIFNSEGKLIEKKEINTNKFEFETKNNSKGIYFVKIKYKDAVKTMKWLNLN